MVTPWVIAGLVFSFITILYAYWKGDFLEKRIAFAYALGVAGTYLVSHTDFERVATFLLDLAFFIYIFFESLRSRKIWVLVACAMVFNSLLIQVVSLFIEGKHTFGLATITGIWTGKGVTLLLAIGVWLGRCSLVKPEITSQN